MIDVDRMQRCVLSNHLYILVACIYATQRRKGGGGGGGLFRGGGGGGGLNVYVIIQK